MPLLTGIHDGSLFIVAGLPLNLTPGVDMALVLRCSAGQGFKAGAAAALGVGAGCGVHIALAALGLSALLAGSPLAFGLLRWTGAAYLVWLGWALMRPRSDWGTAPTTAHCRLRSGWRKQPRPGAGCLARAS